MNPIQGMESVIATVSGYHGIERFKLMKLITHSGASFVGAMGKSTTHLVCWKFEGKKYELAKNLGTLIVSHRWFEDCLKEGKRLPEDPYAMQSGQQVGPISWELPNGDMHGKRRRLPMTESSMPSYKHNSVDSNEVENDTLHCSGVFNLPVSNLLDEPEGTSYSSMHARRYKNKLSNGSNSDICHEAARKSRRLVKKNALSDLSDLAILDCEQERVQIGGSIPMQNLNPELIDSEILRNRGHISLQEVTTGNGSFSNGEMRTREIEEVEVMIETGNLVSLNPHISGAEELSVNEISPIDECCKNVKSENVCCDIEGSENEKMKEDHSLAEFGASRTSTELSCVICWTEFCSTRGILPCGHRFCYTCIQGWADCLVMKGKASTCPLCKSNFTHITVVEGAASLDQKIYSQTIPCNSSKDVLVLLDRGCSYNGPPSSDPVCFECHNYEPGDLLVNCHICKDRWVHSCCLDPPLVPWTCIHCRDLRTLYQRFR
ncbi:uncharacterized protein LOC120279480 [Dioscorea cayenensis subsp. rotundata]|uniref:Uncharacterized protein LOC120279480 n=1 Tax=Dioscorea cayennensis subsp. rotundata TaxID=55577 RepID=A0AB40CWC5_DIOCR|nr:uncharacterized protein LOC120279480 [Dioscorea cayenensis subsp. rotundata]